MFLFIFFYLCSIVVLFFDVRLSHHIKLRDLTCKD